MLKCVKFYVRFKFNFNVCFLALPVQLSTSDWPSAAATQGKINNHHKYAVYLLYIKFNFIFKKNEKQLN